jgi:uncharacterized membrane protein HdeD (DUF308 family)
MGTAPSATPYTTRATTADAAEELKRARRWLTIAGVLSLLGGVVAIVLPNVASVATAIFIGWLLVFASAVYVVDAFSTRDGRRIALRLLMAVLDLVAGAYLLLAPLDGTFTLTVVLVIWFVAIGVARIAMGISGRGTPGAGLLVVSGLLSLALGLLIALELPSSADWAIGLIVGIDLVFWGAQMIAVAQTLGRASPSS